MRDPVWAYHVRQVDEREIAEAAAAIADLIDATPTSPLARDLARVDAAGDEEELREALERLARREERYEWR